MTTAGSPARWKSLANYGARLAMAPIVAAYRFQMALVPEHRRDVVFQGWSQSLSGIPGYLGQYLRRGFYAAVLPECAITSCINWGTVFSSRAARLGHGVYVGARCMVGKARIEQHVTIGSNVDILSGRRQHSFGDLYVPIQQQPGVFDQVTIGENSWIGNGAIIMANVGKRAIVAAGAVVTRPVEDETIVGGNPAKLIRSRVCSPVSATPT